MMNDNILINQILKESISDNIIILPKDKLIQEIFSDDMDLYVDYLRFESEMKSMLSEASISGNFTIFALVAMLIFALLAELLPFWISPISKEYTEKINEILKSTKWKVKLISTEVPNAYAIFTKTVFITTGLQKLLDNFDQEIAILLHECGHVMEHHSYKTAALGIVDVLMPFPLVLFLLSWSYLAIPMFILAMTFPLMTLKLSRKHEFTADSYAVKYGYKEPMAEALKKILELEKKEGGHILQNPKTKIQKIVRKLQILYSTHPETKDRIEKILTSKEINKAFEQGNKSLLKQSIIKAAA